MAIPVQGTHTIEAIFFDMNGTLRVRESHVPTRQASFERMRDLLKIKDASEAYWEEMEHRYKAYSRWAQENLLQLPEKEIWSRWLLPDVPLEQIEPVAAEVTLAWSHRKGRTVPRAGAGETLLELKNRGYHLGVISNSMSTLDIPRSIDAFGWSELFEVVILSSAVKCRKPAPEIFWEATSKLNIDSANCAYLGNRISRDVVGCKRAGFALGFIIEPPGMPRKDEQDQTAPPDAVIQSLGELLDYFPRRVPRRVIV